MNQKAIYCSLLIISFFYFLPIFGDIFELRPWYRPYVQLHGILDYRFQSYRSVNASHTHGRYSSNDHFVDCTLSFAKEPFSYQLEMEFANTKKRNFDWDHISAMGRYLWLNDDIGEPFSLVTGLTLSRAWREAVNDISSFHHGRNELFFHVSLGKQEIKGSQWLSRWWAMWGIGIADRWTPWIEALAAYEWNRCEPHQFSLYINTLWGCGNRKLKVHDFGGYGPIAHRSIDVGFRYIYEFDCYGVITIGYARRLYAHNFPDNTNILTFSYVYPFGPEPNFYLLKAMSLFKGNSNNPLQ